MAWTCRKNPCQSLSFRISHIGHRLSFTYITLLYLFCESKFNERAFLRMIQNVTSLLEVRNLIVDLPTAAGWIRPVNDVSFQLARTESLGLVGESGSGKTMLALALRWRK